MEQEGKGEMGALGYGCLEKGRKWDVGECVGEGGVNRGIGMGMVRVRGQGELYRPLIFIPRSSVFSQTCRGKEGRMGRMKKERNRHSIK